MHFRQLGCYDWGCVFYKSGIWVLDRTGSEPNKAGTGGCFTPGYKWRYKLVDIMAL